MRYLSEIIESIFNYLSPESQGKGITGDILEEYQDLKDSYGTVKSATWLSAIVFRTVANLVLINFQWRLTMFLNYLKTGMRFLIKKKLHSTVNIVGLALGLTVSFTILLWIQGELSYDKFNRNFKDIYRVVHKKPANPDSFAGSPAPLAEKLLSNSPAILKSTRSFKRDGIFISGNQSWYQNNIFYVDPHFLEIFTLKIVKNINNRLLDSPNSLLISESTAEKYFGKTEALGKTITYKKELKVVTAIFKDFPQFSHIHPEVFLPFKSLNLRPSWGAWNYHTYILLKKGTPPHTLNLEVEELAGLDYQIHLQPLEDIHFQYNRSNTEPAMEHKYLLILGTAALIVLFLAIINYINLSTLMLLKRVKEIGIRKAIGASAHQIKLQFYSETFILTSASGILGIALISILKPFVENITGSTLPTQFSLDFTLLYLLFLTISAILTGFYPSWLGARQNSHGIIRSGGKSKLSVNLRKSMLILQFGILSMLITATGIISSQMDFINNFDLGISTSSLINIELKKPETLQRRWFIKKELSKIPGVEAISFNGYNPLKTNWHQSFYWENMPKTVDHQAWIIPVDKDFCKTMGIKFVKGTDKTQLYRDPIKRAYIINRSALKITGWKSIEGKKISIFFQSGFSPLIGVTENFKFRSLRHTVGPCILFITDNFKGSSSQLTLRISAENFSTTMKNIRRAWNSFKINEALEISFMDETIERMYRSEINTGKILDGFTYIAVIIALFGLFTLVSFIVERRSREIAIRKVLGADLKDIVIRFSGSFFQLIAISLVIFLPLTYYYTSLWIESFAYRENLTLIPYFTAALTCLGITLLTVVIHVSRTAQTNPTEILGKD